MPVRKYTYYDFTLSLCPECLQRVDAKIVFENGNVYMLKRCNEHGNSKVLIADDIEYYNGYEKNIIEEFANNPKLDVLIFNLNLVKSTKEIINYLYRLNF